MTVIIEFEIQSLIRKKNDIAQLQKRAKAVVEEILGPFEHVPSISPPVYSFGSEKGTGRHIEVSIRVEIYSRPQSTTIQLQLDPLDEKQLKNFDWRRLRWHWDKLIEVFTKTLRRHFLWPHVTLFVWDKFSEPIGISGYVPCFWDSMQTALREKVSITAISTGLVGLFLAHRYFQYDAPVSDDAILATAPVVLTTVGVIATECVGYFKNSGKVFYDVEF